MWGAQHYATDDPSKKLLVELRRVRPNLEVLSLDPAHIATKYEQASYERKSPGPKFLRQIISKFSAPGTNSGIGAEMYYDGAEFPKVGPAEERARQLLEKKSMEKCEAENLRSNMDSGEPFSSRAEFVLLLAALAALFPEEVKKMAFSGKPLLRSLVRIAEPSQVEWLLNGTRYRHRCSRATLDMLAVGTTSNESLHMELRRWFGGIHELHQSTLLLKLRIFQMSKLIAHNCAFFHPTTVQMKQRFVLARSVLCKRLWKETGAWEKWCGELRIQQEENGRIEEKDKRKDGRVDYRKRHVYKADNPLSLRRKMLKAAVKKHRSPTEKRTRKEGRKRPKRTVFRMETGSGVRSRRGAHR